VEHVPGSQIIKESSMSKKKIYKPTNRSNDVYLRLNKEEKDLLVKKSKEAKLSMNEYLRLLLVCESLHTVLR